MKKISVLFVCLGNICRSPAAEAIFLKLLRSHSIENKFFVDSAGTGSWHVGKEADSRMKFFARKRNINITSQARQLVKEDFKKFDYILAMDDSNFANIIKMKNREVQSELSRVKKIQEFASVFEVKEVPDPYFGGDDGFNNVLDILEDSVSGFFRSIS